MQRNLTKGPITVNLLLFALPLMFGNLLQQLYNVADTWVVGRYLGANALAAVGSSYTLMTFLTSIKGLVNSFGTVIMAAFAAAVKIDSFAYMPVQDFGNVFSTYVAQNYGAKEEKRIKNGIKSAVILTIASLGTRVLLAYVLSAIPVIGVTGIWMSVPIGWFLADIIGIFYYFKSK